MEIIKQGKLPTMRKICDVCGCEFSYNYRDISERIAMEDSCMMGMQYDVHCPCCGKRMLLSDVEVDFVSNKHKK